VAVITVVGSAFGIYLKAAVDRNSQSIETLQIVDYQMGETAIGEVTDPNSWSLGRVSTNGIPDRQAHKRVTFGHAFDSPPQVVVAIQDIDAAGDDQGRDVRVRTWAGNVGRDGFDLYVQTWIRSLVHDLALSWTAVETRASNKSE
jgi:hypothetical protein